MNKMKKVLWMLACLCLTTGASAQMQSGIVRTLERPGKPSEGITGVTINVLEYPNAIVTKIFVLLLRKYMDACELPQWKGVT